jgi:hypothetical protein
MLVGITGAVQIVLGLLFWTGHLLTLIPLHMVIGFVFVLALWTTAALAALARVPWSYAVLAFAWGVVVILLGLTQQQLLPGPNHWIIRALHLLVGLGAMGQANGLVRRIGKGVAQGPAAAEPVAGPLSQA